MRECDCSALPLPSLEGGRKGGLGARREPERPPRGVVTWSTPVPQARHSHQELIPPHKAEMLSFVHLCERFVSCAQQRVRFLWWVLDTAFKIPKLAILTAKEEPSL